MSTHMVAFGASGATPKQRMVHMVAGLGLLPGVIVDQHFEARNRLGRLLAIIAQNPSLLGIGVDEDTAGVVGPDRVLEVRSEEHTSELQSQSNLVCRLLLEKKKNTSEH